MSIQMAGRSIQTDHEGFLLDPSDWNEDVAEEIARREELELTDDHWKVIRFARDYYDEHFFVVEMRDVLKYLAEDLGQGSHAKKRLFELFPYGFVKQACKIAGLKRPRSWSTG